MNHPLRSLRALAALGFLALAAAGLTPAGCFYPSYTFDEVSPGASGGGGSTTTTTTTTTSTTASGGGGGQGGGQGAVESDCLDGVDNDDDGKVDCADSDCDPGYQCVDDIPTGWGSLGYLALFRGDPGSVPPCPDDLPQTAYSGHDQLQSSDAQCSACDCGMPTQQTCSLVTDFDPNAAGVQPMQLSNAACGNVGSTISALSVPPNWQGVCYHAEQHPGGQLCNNLSCNKSITVAQATVAGGQCSAVGGVPTKPTPTWKVAGKACKGTASGGGCSGGKTCQPRPAPPFESGLCVYSDGDQPCPAGAFQKKYSFYGDYDDARGCTSCQCGPATGGFCELDISVYSDPAIGVCMNEVGKVTSGGCFDFANPSNPDVYGWTSTVKTAPTGGQCDPVAPSTPTGIVTPTEPTTFCCVP